MDQNLLDGIILPINTRLDGICFLETLKAPELSI